MSATTRRSSLPLSRTLVRSFWPDGPLRPSGGRRIDEALIEPCLKPTTPPLPAALVCRRTARPLCRYNGKRNKLIINLQTINDDEEKVRFYCYSNPETPVLDAIKNVLGLDK